MTTHFGTVKEAIAKHAFERGWLPPVLPESAKNIVEQNDLDSNFGKGSFEYESKDRNKYIQQISALGAYPANNSHEDRFILILNGSQWEILLPRDDSKAEYTTKLLR